MKRHVAGVVAIAAAAALCPALSAGGIPAAAGTRDVARWAVSGGTWQKAKEVPGTAALNSGGFAVTESVSCGAPGDCSAGGYYTHGAADQEAFIADEVNGVWRRAMQVAGTLNAGHGAEITSVSCVSARTCTAGGDYADASGRSQAFAISEVNGGWGQAREIAATLNKGVGAQISSVSCASAGNCSAGGYYTDRAGHGQAFVVSEVSGTWRTAEEVPGSGSLNKGGSAAVYTVSCGSAGYCSAGGVYSSSYNSHTGVYTAQAFAVSERRGAWGTAMTVARALNRGGSADIGAVSCATAGSCSAGGSYAARTGVSEAFVISESNGTWGTAHEVPGIGRLNAGGDAVIDTVSCATPGNCSAGGLYAPAHAGGEAFVVSQTGGTWRAAQQVPGSGTLNKGGLARILSVSCASAGNCSAGGYYTDSSASPQALVAGESNGTWGTAEEVPGSGALNQGSLIGDGRAAVESVSCASPGHCGAGGEYVDVNGGQQAFIVSES